MEEVFIGKKLCDLHHLFKKVIKKEMDKLNLPNGYAFILRFLCQCEEGIINQKDVVEYAKFKPSTISITLQNMENDGLIERKKEQDDNRKINVCLTSKGKEVGKQIEDIFRNIEANFDKALGDSKEIFSNLIDTLDEKLERIGDSND